MKRQISWHVDALSRQKEYLEKLQIELQSLFSKVEKSKANIDFYSLQIETAIKDGKLDFDEDKYLIKHKPKM